MRQCVHLTSSANCVMIIIKSFRKTLSEENKADNVENTNGKEEKENLRDSSGERCCKDLGSRELFSEIIMRNDLDILSERAGCAVTRIVTYDRVSREHVKRLKDFC